MSTTKKLINRLKRVLRGCATFIVRLNILLFECDGGSLLLSNTVQNKHFYSRIYLQPLHNEARFTSLQSHSKGTSDRLISLCVASGEPSKSIGRIELVGLNRHARLPPVIKTRYDPDAVTACPRHSFVSVGPCYS